MQDRWRPSETAPQSPLRHVLEAQQFTRGWLEGQLFPLADKMELVAQNGGDRSLAGKRLFNLFYEPSTRTRVSFETAMQLLGGQVSGTENARAFSSVVKGETLEDSIRILEGYFYDAMYYVMMKKEAHNVLLMRRSVLLLSMPGTDLGNIPLKHYLMFILQKGFLVGLMVR